MVVDTDSDTSALTTILALHFLMFPNGRYSKKNNLGKSSLCRYKIKDSQQSCIFISCIMQGLLSHIEDLVNRGENMQPFFLGIGNFENISQYFVYLDGALVSTSNFLKSVDICFKCFHIFNVDYPKASEYFWCFDENYLYEIDMSQKQHSKVSILLNNSQREST